MENKVSIWIGQEIVKETDDDERDVLEQLGIKEYDEDMVEIYFVDGKMSNVEDLLEPLSFSETFESDVSQKLKKMQIDKGSYIIAIYDYSYDMSLSKELNDPIFIGIFDYEDDFEDEE